MSAPAAGSDAAAVAEAADWVLRMQSGPLNEQERHQFEHWRSASSTHQQAWGRAESVLAAFNNLPAPVLSDALHRLGGYNRREMLKALALLVTLPAGGVLAARHLPWRTALAEHRTATGEQADVVLQDGTRLVLNTASAVDVTFNADARTLHLRAGEIMVTTAHDARPFSVHTAQGKVVALGTRFSVRQVDDERTRVAVFEHAVRIEPTDGPAQHLPAGRQIDFSALETQASVADAAGKDAWTQGMFVAKDLPLKELACELARYQPGVMRVDPSVSSLRVSGAFPVRDINASLNLLEKTLPLRIEHRNRWWVVVQAR